MVSVYPYCRRFKTSQKVASSACKFSFTKAPVILSLAFPVAKAQALVPPSFAHTNFLLAASRGDTSWKANF